MDILSDLSNAALSTAIESNRIGFLEYFGRFAQVTITYRPDMVRLLSESGPFPIFNRIVRAQFGSNDDIPACIETPTAPYRTRKLPLSWTVGPVTTPANLGEHLLAYGFTVDSDTTPGMVADLHTLNEDNTCPGDVSIQQVTDLAMLATFYDMLRVGYGMPDAIIDFASSADRQAGIPDPAIFRNYVAYQNGKPVGCSSLILNAGVAGIYGVATIPDARRQGVGAELTLFPLREARAMGYRVGVLHSTEMGYNMYCSLGFKQHCTLLSYRLKPEERTETFTDP